MDDGSWRYCVDHQTKWLYDDLARLTQMKTKIGDFSYNYIGSTPLLQDIQVPNGNDTVFACGKYRTYDYTHDQVLQLTGATEKDLFGVLQANHSWTYDNAGNRTQKVDSGSTTNASYIAINQVTTTTGAEAFTFAHDANGNMLRKTGPVEAGIAEIAYAWDADNRLTHHVTKRQTAGVDPTTTIGCVSITTSITWARATR